VTKVSKSRVNWQFAREYVDLGISGSRVRRPELHRLVVDAHRHQFDAVIVWEFDRFARSLSHLLRALETFQALGIDFVSLSESLDASTPTGKMVFTVLGAVAELERSLIYSSSSADQRTVLGSFSHSGTSTLSGLATSRGTRCGRRPPFHR
jgi:DNA invertase Pin-like site-specific DNA recombinase